MAICAREHDVFEFIKNSDKKNQVAVFYDHKNNGYKCFFADLIAVVSAIKKGNTDYIGTYSKNEDLDEAISSIKSKKQAKRRLRIQEENRCRN